MDKVDLGSVSLLNPSLLPGLKQDTKKPQVKSGVQGTRKTFFSELLETSIDKSGEASFGELGPLRDLAPSEEALTELMDAVHSAGSDLADRPFHNEIIQYKQAVRNFIHYVVENGYEMEKIRGVKKKTVTRGETEWKEMVYHQVKVIDRKLEEMAAAILSGQTTQLERISKLDELKGLLVDLTITGVIRERDG